MGAMTAETSPVQLAHGRPFTVDDLEAMPDDGNRYELIDGTLIVSPAPGLNHQTVVGNIFVALQDFTKKFLPVAPVLAVEVFSSSSVLNDLNNKKAAYQRLGVQNYWVIDPEDPTLTAFELDDAGVYQMAAEIKGADAFETRRPFPVRIVPMELLDWLADNGPK
jgi:Uma2 family endonuclease